MDDGQAQAQRGPLCFRVQHVASFTTIIGNCREGHSKQSPWVVRWYKEDGPGTNPGAFLTTENVPPETQSYDYKKTSYRLTGSRPSATRTLRGFAFISPEAMRAPGAHKSEGARQS